MNTQQEYDLLMQAIHKLGEINMKRKKQAQHDMSACQCYQCLAYRTLQQEARLIKRQTVPHA